MRRLRPDSVGARGNRHRLQHSRCARRTSTSTGATIAKIFLGQITNWNDPAITALNKGDKSARPEDHAGLPLGRLGHDVQLHRLPLVGQRHLEVEDRHVDSAGLAGGLGRQGLGRRRRGRSPARRRRSATSTPRSRSRTTSGSQPSRTRPGSFLYPSIRRIPAAALAFPKVPANNELHIVEPAEVGDSSRTRSHLHLHHPAQDDAECRRAAEDGLLGADAGPDGAVHGEAVLRADLEGRVLVASEKTLKQIHT